MWKSFLIGCGMILITTIIHSGVTLLVIRSTFKNSKKRVIQRKYLRSVWLAVIVIIMFFATILESGIWTICYLYLGALQSFEEALYFSIVTFSTLGFGDLILEQEWRFLSALEAANGIIMFGWSTAIVIAAVQKLYQDRQ